MAFYAELIDNTDYGAYILTEMSLVNLFQKS